MTTNIIFYELPTCTTCKKAKKYLQEKEILFEERPIRLEPPSREQLDIWMAENDSIKKYLNTSSEDYRKLGFAKQNISKEMALDAIAQNPNLIKRPLCIIGTKAIFGFKEELYEEYLKNEGLL